MIATQSDRKVTHSALWEITRNTALVFQGRDELAAMLDEWAGKIGAVNEVDAASFAEKIMAAGWSK
jgi:hypothetical protein